MCGLYAGRGGRVGGYAGLLQQHDIQGELQAVADMQYKGQETQHPVNDWRPSEHRPPCGRINMSMNINTLFFEVTLISFVDRVAAATSLHSQPTASC